MKVEKVEKRDIYLNENSMSHRRPDISLFINTKDVHNGLQQILVMSVPEVEEHHFTINEMEQFGKEILSFVEYAREKNKNEGV